MKQPLAVQPLVLWNGIGPRDSGADLREKRCVPIVRLKHSSPLGKGGADKLQGHILAGPGSIRAFGETPYLSHLEGRRSPHLPRAIPRADPASHHAPGAEEGQARQPECAPYGRTGGLGRIHRCGPAQFRQQSIQQRTAALQDVGA